MGADTQSDRRRRGPRGYAQFGEDRKLRRIFGDRRGVCVEVGGHDGVTGSNTYLFEQLGWECLVVEPVPYLARAIREARSCRVVEAAADARDGEAEFLIAVGGDMLSTLDNESRRLSRIDEHDGRLERIVVRTRTLDHILEEAGVARVDFVTIDVEGNELRVLEGLSLERWQPRIVIVEDNSFCSDDAVQAYLARHGYTRFRITGVNHWYCRADDAQLATRARRASARVFAAAVRLYGAARRRLHRR